MRQTLQALLVLLAAACATPDVPTAARTPADAPADAPALDRNTVNTAYLPDLIVDARATQQNWLVRVEDFPAEFCSVQEGGVTPGTHTVLRFTVTTPNVG